MACSAPINIDTKQLVKSISGSFNCVYDATLISGSTVTLSNDLHHLSVKVTSNGTSKVSFYNSGTYTPSEIRIYKPALHTFNGVHAEAELLIVHSSSSNRGLIVSVPIAMGGSKRSGLNTIIAAANTLNPGTLAMTASAPIPSAVDVNDFIPSKPFYVYNGTLPYESCGGNYYYAVFTDPISIGTPILNLVPSEIKTAPPPALLQKSKGGPVVNGLSTAAGDYALYEVVVDDECDEGSSGKFNVNVSKPNAAAPASNVLWGLLIAFALVLVYWGVRKLNEQTGGAVAAVSDAVSKAVSNVVIVAGKTASDAGEAVSDAGEAVSKAVSKAASEAAENMITIVKPTTTTPG
jgi:carbonic anhydrase